MQRVLRGRRRWQSDARRWRGRRLGSGVILNEDAEIDGLFALTFRGCACPLGRVSFLKEVTEIDALFAVGSRRGIERQRFRQGLGQRFGKGFRQCFG
jgi:hypothetical protein